MSMGRFLALIRRPAFLVALVLSFAFLSGGCSVKRMLYVKAGKAAKRKAGEIRERRESAKTPEPQTVGKDTDIEKLPEY
jgi:hypothetical protein